MEIKRIRQTTKENEKESQKEKQVHKTKKCRRYEKQLSEFQRLHIEHKYRKFYKKVYLARSTFKPNIVKKRNAKTMVGKLQNLIQFRNSRRNFQFNRAEE